MCTQFYGRQRSLLKIYPYRKHWHKKKNRNRNEQEFSGLQQYLSLLINFKAKLSLSFSFSLYCVSSISLVSLSPSLSSIHNFLSLSLPLLFIAFYLSLPPSSVHSFLSLSPSLPSHYSTPSPSPFHPPFYFFLFIFCRLSLPSSPLSPSHIFLYTVCRLPQEWSEEGGKERYRDHQPPIFTPFSSNQPQVDKDKSSHND